MANLCLHGLINFWSLFLQQITHLVTLYLQLLSSDVSIIMWNQARHTLNSTVTIVTIGATFTKLSKQWNKHHKAIDARLTDDALSAWFMTVLEPQQSKRSITYISIMSISEQLQYKNTGVTKYWNDQSTDWTESTGRQVQYWVNKLFLGCYKPWDTTRK